MSSPAAAQDAPTTGRLRNVLLVLATLVPIAVLVFSGGHLTRLADVRVRWAPLMLGALGVAVIITTLRPEGDADAHRFINLATYAVALVVLWRNRCLPGLRTVFVGTVLNVAAITANHGVMPAGRRALAFAGLPARSSGFLSSTAVSHPRLIFLGDIFAVPSWVPFANVFSIGDVLIVGGIGFAILCVGGSRLIPSGIRTGDGMSRTTHCDH